MEKYLNSKSTNMIDIALFSATKDGVRLSTRVFPRAKQNRLGESIQDAKGRWLLKVYVTALPTEGKANTAVIKLLSKNLKFKPSQIILEQGASHKDKTFLITGNSAIIMSHLKEVLS